MALWTAACSQGPSNEWFLLELADLPNSWRVEPIPPDDDTDTVTCADGSEPVPLGGEELGQRFFTNGPRFLISTATQFPTAEQASDALRRFAEGLDACGEQQASIGGRDITSNDERLATIPLGDESAAYAQRFEETASGTGYVIIDVTVRYDNILSSVAVAGSETISVEDAESFAQIVTARAPE